MSIQRKNSLQNKHIQHHQSINSIQFQIKTKRKNCFGMQLQVIINIYTLNFMDSIKTSSQQPPKQKMPSSTKQLQFHVANVYQQIAQMLEERDDLEIELPNQICTAIQRVNLIKSVLGYLLEQRHNAIRPIENHKQQIVRKEEENSNIFNCEDCENYEKNLQKLQGEVRNHIRTHQQLKLYQDGLEQKIQEYKKEKKEIERKYESVKKKYDELKSNVSAHTERMSKYESQNQKLKSELKNYRTSNKGSTNDDHHSHKRLNRYQSNKENLADWRNNGHNPKHERTSVERRNESTERMRVSVNVKSTKGIPISSKIIQEKNNRDENHKQKQKVLKNRIGFGY